MCVARVCGYDHPDCDSVRQWRQQAGTIAVVAEGAFCVGLGLAGKENTAFVRQKGVQSHSLGSTLHRSCIYHRVGGPTVKMQNLYIILHI